MGRLYESNKELDNYDHSLSRPPLTFGNHQMRYESNKELDNKDHSISRPLLTFGNHQIQLTVIENLMCCCEYISVIRKFLFYIYEVSSLMLSLGTAVDVN